VPGARTTPPAEYASVPDPTARLAGRAIGLDVGGTGIKAAVVDLSTGALVTDRIRELTPRPMTPGAVLDVISSVMQQLGATGAVTADMRGGTAFPSVIRAGHAMTVVHGEAAWVGQDVQRLISDRAGRSMSAINDADAAGVAEVAYGAGKDQRGVLLLLDLGTGIGTSLFTDGRLVPNIQLGHIELHGHDAEVRLSPAARKQRGVGLTHWAGEFNELLARNETYIAPDLIIIAGGMAKEFPKFGQLLETKAKLVPAALGTVAGIVGAARVSGG
jgi:polyphosphate glucokinase